MKKSDKHWEKMGKSDPYYWVTTQDKYHGDIRDSAEFEEFFAEGESYLQKLFQIIRTRVSTDFSPQRILDFGCGVGRVLLPLARESELAVGADIANSMLQKAQEHCQTFGINNTKLIQSDDQLSQVEGKFDFIHSIYVFQHIQCKRGLKIFRLLLQKLNPGGVAMIQFTYSNDLSKKRKMINWMKMHIPLVLPISNLLHFRAPNAPMMEMHNYSLNNLHSILHEFDAKHIYSRFTKDGPYHGVMLFIQISKTDERYIELSPIP